MMTDAAALVTRYLRQMEARDLAAAQACLAPDFTMIFPGSVRLHRLEDLVAWSRTRYREVRKTFERIDGAGDVVWVSGMLAGTWLDGRTFDQIRYVDRFELKDGLILRQDVWNDMGEYRLAEGRRAQPGGAA